MTATDLPALVVDLRVVSDYGQIMIYSDAAVTDDDVSALDDAEDNGRFVGAGGGTLDLLTPGTRGSGIPMRVEVWATEPAADTGEWLDEVDVDLDVPDGRLIFQAPESGLPIPAELPAGAYRARVSGSGYTATGDAGSDGDDCYRLRLWPRTTDTEPECRRARPGRDR
jgi:hypothetical protein